MAYPETDQPALNYFLKLKTAGQHAAFSRVDARVAAVFEALEGPGATTKDGRVWPEFVKRRLELFICCRELGVEKKNWATKIEETWRVPAKRHRYTHSPTITAHRYRRVRPCPIMGRFPPSSAVLPVCALGGDKQK